MSGQQELGGGADLGLPFRELEEGELFVGGTGLQRYLQWSEPTFDLHVHWREKKDISVQQRSTVSSDASAPPYYQNTARCYPIALL